MKEYMDIKKQEKKRKRRAFMKEEMKFWATFLFLFTIFVSIILLIISL